MTAAKYDTQYFRDDQGRKIKMPVSIRVGDKKRSPIDGMQILRQTEKYNVAKLKEMTQQRLAKYKAEYEVSAG